MTHCLDARYTRHGDNISGKSDEFTIPSSLPTAAVGNNPEGTWGRYRVPKKKGDVRMGPQIQGFTHPMFSQVSIGRLGQETVSVSYCPLA